MASGKFLVQSMVKIPGMLIPGRSNMEERRKVWAYLKGSPFAIRRMAIKYPLTEGAAYGTEMVERRKLPDRRGADKGGKP